ncbi:hypothetical protein GPUN_1680 [Glaciecola punicea ACAM 611]|uniref:Uncharacterized protein n=1 Tax=Glaciecola punicea ACAM 611 TaxID=1121923 RepID=H5TBW9_9ALTE|nr:hypothetical protein GPUN_1680 [Glaciecola punicea ACAM 611]
MSAPASVVVQTHHAQVFLSSQCDPLWLGALLKGLAAQECFSFNSYNRAQIGNYTKIQVCPITLVAPCC